MLRRRWVCLECVRVRACVRTKQLINRARAFTDAASSAFYAFIKFRVREWCAGWAEEGSVTPTVCVVLFADLHECTCLQHQQQQGSSTTHTCARATTKKRARRGNWNTVDDFTIAMAKTQTASRSRNSAQLPNRAGSLAGRQFAPIALMLRWRRFVGPPANMYTIYLCRCKTAAYTNRFSGAEPVRVVMVVVVLFAAVDTRLCTLMMPMPTTDERNISVRNFHLYLCVCKTLIRTEHAWRSARVCVLTMKCLYLLHQTCRRRRRRRLAELMAAACRCLPKPVGKFVFNVHDDDC